MTNEFMGERRRGLEEEFFARENRRLLERLREQQRQQETREALREASGISDEHLLDRFVEMGLSPETLVALTLVPLVHVAWSDGSLHGNERDAVLASARERAELAEGSVAYELLSGWLNQQPAESLFEAWQAYAGALITEMDEESRRGFRDDLLQRARSVAEAAGGTLGIGRISSAEREAIGRVEQVLS